MSCPPVLLLIFNRPDLAVDTVRRIVEASPSHLYIAGDGARSPDEQALVDQTRNAVLDDIPDHIPVTTLFRDNNLGCKQAVEQSISWFFEHVESGIILEDDCVPSRSFFQFCANMLERYDSDPSVMHISGYTHRPTGTNSYTYSRFASVWGWATWRRAWEHYPVNVGPVDRRFVDDMRGAFQSDEQAAFFMRKLAQVSAGELDTWDISWSYAVLSNYGLTVRPDTNLVRNTGVGDPRATHTTRSRSSVTENAEADMTFPLSSPAVKIPNYRADHDYFRSNMRGRRDRLSWILGLVSTRRTMRRLTNDREQ